MVLQADEAMPRNPCHRCGLAPCDCDPHGMLNEAMVSDYGSRSGRGSGSAWRSWHSGSRSGSGALVGEVLQGNKEVAEAKETIDALTHGDVSALVQQGMAKHASGFDEFTSYIKKILIIAACILGAYLCIPIFVARKTAETCSKKHLTRPPFPTNEKL